MLDPDLTASFWAFVAERHRVWWRRHVQQRQWPWTTDPVLRDAHFTNVYRDFDPGTRAALERLARAPTLRDAVAFTVAYRFLNLRANLDRFGPEGPYLVDRHAWLDLIDGLYAAKVTVRTRWHLTPSRRFLALALEAVALPGFDLGSTSASTWAALRTLPGVDSFTGWQLYADLASSGWVRDLDPLFVQVGDGAAFALAVLEGRRSLMQYHHDGGTSRVDGGRVRPGRREQSRLAELVRELHADQLVHLPAGLFTVPPGRLLAVWDLEHALCEWLRYELLRTGARQLTTRTKYRGLP